MNGYELQKYRGITAIDSTNFWFIPSQHPDFSNWLTAME